jgi:hypothetical protein
MIYASVTVIELSSCKAQLRSILPTKWGLIAVIRLVNAIAYYQGHENVCDRNHVL